jgi:hypothetical protein
MRFSQGNQPIEALLADSPDDSFANRVCRWTLRRGFQYFDPEPHNGFVEVLGKNAIAIMQQVFVPLLRSNRLTQLRCSMTTNTYSCRKITVTARKKSQAMIPWACRRRKVDQRISPRGRRVGRVGRYLFTVRGET